MVENIEVSVVIPCLNEEKTIASCVDKAMKSFAEGGLRGEVIVVDNGSTDQSKAIAAARGAKVIDETRKGYGSALRRGIDEAQGSYIIMADGDDTYDFSLSHKFVGKLKEGYDLVMGSRFRGKILPGAMSWSHRYVGNPILSGMLRLFFGGTVSDSHCGLRAFTKDAYKKMGLHTTGMEFASEMVIHSLKKKLKIAEIPIIYYARLGESKLASFRDAWRHMRFMLVYSPGYLFLLPGAAVFTASFLLSCRLLLGPIYWLGRPWDIHVMVFSAMFTLLGWEILNLGHAAKMFAYEISLEQSRYALTASKFVTLEKSLLLGTFFILSGFAIMTLIIYKWANNNFGELSEVKTGVFSLTLIVMGFQTIFTAFLSGMLSIKYR
ncbi:MAG: hypothetical protein A2339_07475 [Elusimicrobia bacterium RIFOXYB12_FULL_50_12]|nr:MAG: hypothetical protein A2278_03255 [Elusimicrobia bacterium RIFOXYA12_FULL_49_49]OGS10887.1 MAG: hypothetical protein A2386_06805 [Elusimicrobia bacterium RIFOXYB1_FULL_48_9]OGS15580.1 MAG: hypothetical protein A2251_03505 [Elusimicrobia bacterium RIFOXYA2_FULL_47_53]OGS26864.1 MAG: hypothetical protein A2339_07475 [Elusimicrobia bacterium RIFOXYB12_FULL_50_12]OGS30679.1 MAG: hypothetical protein A2323_07310 [Elusimicrobia bacterium RIFOXYB2_FULL_46_23]